LWPIRVSNSVDVLEIALDNFEKYNTPSVVGLSTMGRSVSCWPALPGKKRGIATLVVNKDMDALSPSNAMPPGDASNWNDKAEAE
jgi:hypothetical protein